MLRKWQDIPDFMKCPEVKKYYNILNKKRVSLYIKRGLDVILAITLLIICAVPMMIIGLAIKLDSPGPVFYRQERVTAYGRRFRIHKFRTMVINAERKGSSVTVDNDPRITRVGAKLRGLRLDELPQLIDVLEGNMSFVGTRPESVKYFKAYTKEMYASLLLPTGITSEASIRYKDEAKLLKGVTDVDHVYINVIMPEKMKYNLKSIREFSLIGEGLTLVRTVLAVCGKNYDTTG